MNALRAMAIAVVQFAVTAGCIVGATVIAAHAVRAGLDTWPLFGQLLRGAALILAWPAQLVLKNLEPGSSWLWVLLGLNSVIWALVIELAWSTYRGRRDKSVA